MLYYYSALFVPRVAAVAEVKSLGGGYFFANDFYPVWLTSRELLRARRDPYTPEMTREIQLGLYGRPLDPHRQGDPADQRAFVHPAFTDLVFWPAAELSFPMARIVVVASLGILTIAGIFLWLRALDWNLSWRWIGVSLLLILSSYPALEALFVGQIGLLVIFLLAATVAALHKERLLLAGICLALSMMKPQLVALVTLYLLVWASQHWVRGKRFVYGFFLTLASLVSTSLIVLPHWISSWVHGILVYRDYTRPPLVSEVITRPLGPQFCGPATFILTTASLVIALILIRKNRRAPIQSFEFWFTFTVLLALSVITILPGQAVYDHLVLVPAIFLLIRDRHRFLSSGRVSQLLFTIGAAALFWPWIAALGLTLLSCFAPKIPSSAAVLSLPLRTTASLPFAVLALLFCAWRVTSQQHSRPA